MTGSTPWEPPVEGASASLFDRYELFTGRFNVEGAVGNANIPNDFVPVPLSVLDTNFQSGGGVKVSNGGLTLDATIADQFSVDRVYAKFEFSLWWTVNMVNAFMATDPPFGNLWRMSTSAADQRITTLTANQYIRREDASNPVLTFLLRHQSATPARHQGLNNWRNVGLNVTPVKFE